MSVLLKADRNILALHKFTSYQPETSRN